MKNNLPFFIIVLLIFSIPKKDLLGQVYFNENFEGSGISEKWSFDYVKDSREWLLRDGGYQIPPESPNGNNPPHAYQGKSNAWFFLSTINPAVTKLISPKIELGGAYKAELRFWHAQVAQLSDVDYLKVYYRKSKSSNWVLLKEYLLEVPNWTEQKIPLPNTDYTDDYQIGFEGYSSRGNGVCIDSLVVMETGSLSRAVRNAKLIPSYVFGARTKETGVPVARLDINTVGNTGDLTLNTINFLAKYTDINDIKEVSLYKTNDTLFNGNNLIGTATINTANGTISFTGLSENLAFGTNSFWLAFDISETAKPGNTLSAELLRNGITVNGTPLSFGQQATNRDIPIIESLFFDGFEGTDNWNKVSEFEIAEPQGLGGAAGGEPDPSQAYKGKKVLGTDLTGLGKLPGDFDTLSVLDQYYAISPTIYPKYYNELKVNFFRMLSQDSKTHAKISVSKDGGATWIDVFSNNSLMADQRWRFVNLDLKDFNRSDSLRLRFSLGSHVGRAFGFSGWNIDEFAFTGNHLEKDVGVEKWFYPLSGCDHEDGDSVKVRIRNYAEAASPNIIPVAYSFDGGTTMFTDTIRQSIPKNGYLDFIFPTKADLSTPGAYPNVFAKTLLEGDEDSTNNKIDTSLHVFPIHSLPFSEDFEANNGYMKASGKGGELWAHAKPIFTEINSAASGEKVWVLNQYGNYYGNDSSMLESPCFDFTGKDHMIFECKLWVEAESHTDGMALEYSLDGGNKWERILDNDGFNKYWNWYYDSTCLSLKSFGWTGVSKGWFTARHMLPTAVNGQSKVKFRFIFQSNESYHEDGVAIDDIKIFRAPKDLEVLSINDLVSACELGADKKLKLTIKNRGIEKLSAGDKLVIGIDLNGRSKEVVDTLTLASDLAVDAETQITLSKGIDLSGSGDYIIKAYSLMEEMDHFYRKENQDTALLTVKSKKPHLELGEDIFTLHPDTITLNVKQNDIVNYTWNDGATGNFPTYKVPKEGGKIWVKVRNSVCETSDTILITRLKRDLSISEIVNPKSKCEFGLFEKVSLKIFNKGTDTLSVGDSIALYYKLENTPAFRDTLKITQALNPGDTWNYRFTKTLNLDGLKDSLFEASVNFLSFEEVYDTTKLNLVSYGYSPYKLTKNSVSVGGTSYSLDAKDVIQGPSSYTRYMWNNDSTLNTQNYEAKTSGWHKITVFDQNNCPSSDSVFVHLRFYDVTVVEAIGLDNACEGRSNYYPEIKIKNLGDTLTSSDNVFVGYSLNGAQIDRDTIKVVTPIYPNTVINHKFNVPVDYSALNNYTFKFYSANSKDNKPENDTLLKEVSIYGAPAINLVSLSNTTDAIVKGREVYTRKSGFTIDAGAGRSSYLWNTGSKEQTITVAQGGWYSVSVQEHGLCAAKDSLFLVFLKKDVGVLSLDSPRDTCSYESNPPVTVTIKNFGNDTIFKGSSIMLGYKMNGGKEVSESLVLSANLKPSETIQHSFANKPNVFGASNYIFETRALLGGDGNHSNDVKTATIVVHGRPFVNLGSDRSIRNQIVLDGGGGPNYTYLWDNSKTERVRIVNKKGMNNCWVRVTNQHGCSASDTVNIYVLKTDLSIEISNPIASKCTHINEPVYIRVKNEGNDTLPVNTSYVVKLLLDETPYGKDTTITIANEFKPNDVSTFTFNQGLSITSEGQHKVSAIISLEEDNVASNDTSSISFETYGEASIELGADIVSSKASETIKVADTYATYKWWEGGNPNNILSTSSSLTVSDSGRYHVQVTNANGCTGEDFINVLFKLYTIKIQATNPPSIICREVKNEPVRFRLTNDSERPLGDSIKASYKVLGQPTVEETFPIGSVVANGASINFQFSKNLNIPQLGEYPFALTVDAGNGPTTIKTTLHVHENFVYKFKKDTVIFRYNAPFIAEAIPGDNTYTWDDGSKGLIYRVDINSNRRWITLTVENNTTHCIAKDSIFLDLITKIDNLPKLKARVKVYPIPAKDYLFIEIKGKKRKSYSIDLLNVLGVSEYTEKHQNKSSLKTKIFVSDLQKGVYYLRIRDEEGIKVVKIILH